MGARRATISGSMAAHAPLYRWAERIMKPPPTGCHTTLARSTAGLKCLSTTCGRLQRRGSQNSISCSPPPSITHSTGLRTPSAPATPKVSSAVRGCMQRGSVSGLTGMAPHVAW